MRRAKSHFRPTILLCLLLAACGEDDGSPAGSQATASGDGAADIDPYAGCSASAIEADSALPELSGSGVQDGELPPGDYVLSTTYIALKPGDEVRARFMALSGPAVAEAQQQAGLLGMALAISEDCSAGRTLTVWRDEAAMYAFVAGPAHAAAMAAVGEISRGASIAMHWQGDETEASWEEAAARLAAFDGTKY